MIFCLSDLVVYQFYIGLFVMYDIHTYSALDGMIFRFNGRFRCHSDDNLCSGITFGVVRCGKRHVLVTNGEVVLSFDVIK